MKKEFILYSSDGCHLCELALTACNMAFNRGSNDYSFESRAEVKDIVDDELLVELYGVHIPVLKRVEDNKELFWPFDEDQVVQLIAEKVKG